MSRRAVQPCGTAAAYQRHRKHGEAACDPCRAANSRYEARRSGRSPLRSRGALARFWSKVALPDPNGCMLWLGTKTPSGYGQASVDGVQFQAHRLALLLAEGPSADSNRTQAAHMPVICHRPECVAPAHLRWATHAENMADKHLDGTENIGTRNGSAKLTEAQVSAIRLRYRRGDVSQRALAAEFSVSQVAILDAIHGRTWAHVREAS